MAFRKIINYMEMIKIEHTVFALPFALTSTIIAAQGVPELDKIIWIVLAVFGARTSAMSLNRLIDAEIDAKNPRTSQRHIPSGKVKKIEAASLSVIGLLIMTLSAYKLNALAFKLSPVAMLIIGIYPFTKRFTSACHLLLGAAISLAPLGGWIAIKGSVNITAAILTISVAFWVAGFDIIYALQDIDFDRSYKLHSIPAKLGIRNSLKLARLSHAITLAGLIAVGLRISAGFFYFLGIAISSMLMFKEHSMIAKDLSKINYAFFNLNGYISLTVFIFTLINYITE